MGQDKLRVASLQYYIRPVKSWKDFAQQVRSLVETAADYRCQLVIFPEYFTCQLLTLSDLHRPIHEQIRTLANEEERYLEMMVRLAHEFHVHIVGGSIPSFGDLSGNVYNRCYIFAPNGRYAYQAKLHTTRFELEEWKISQGRRLKIFEASFGKLAVAICYDIEFPEIARVAAKLGANILICPSSTDDRQGFLRVRYCAHARAIENQLYVVQSSTVGSLPMVPAVHLNYGQASILTPCDFAFARDGILAEGITNQETLVIGDLDLSLIEETRSKGTVLPLRDSHQTAELIGVTEEVPL